MQLDRITLTSKSTKLLFLVVILFLNSLLLGCTISSSPSLKASESPTKFSVNQTDKIYADIEALAAFNSVPETLYRIGPGDLLTVEVLGRPNLSGQHKVGPDGYITLPVVGLMKMQGQDRQQSLDSLISGYSKFYTDISVTVRIDEYNSNHVLILGRVTHPGSLQFDAPPTLLEVITLAGGLPVGGLDSEKSTLTRCAVFRGKDRVLWINLSKLLSGQDLRYNLQLRAGDLVYIPDADGQLVYALGEVASPGAYNMSPEMSLLDIVAQAGGLTASANSKKIHLIRPGEGTKMTVSLGEMLSPNPDLNFSLQQGDVLYVPSSTLGKLSYVMREFGPLTSFLLFTQAIGSSSDGN